MKFILLMLLAVSAHAERVIMEGKPSTGNSILVSSNSSQVDIATNSAYGGSVPNVGLYVTSNVVVGNCVFYSTGSAVCPTGTFSNAEFTGGTVANQTTFQSTVTVQGNAFSVGGSTLVVSGGNVGVGTASPTNNLTVSGQAGVGTTSNLGSVLNVSGDATNIGLLLVKDTNSNKSWVLGPQVGAANGTGAFNFYANESAAVRVSISTGGNVGIGTTSPAQTLDVSGSIAVSSTTHSGYELITNNCTTCSSVKASCSAGKWAMGGGFTIGATCVIQDSYPVNTASWQADTMASCSSITAYVLCSRSGP